MLPRTCLPPAPSRQFHLRVVWIAALAATTILTLPGARAAEKKPPLAPSRDARLSRRLTLHAAGIPVGRVLRLLTQKTGVRLSAAGVLGDERLVAFVPDAPLSEVLERIAELYRLSWVPTGRGAETGYELVKPLAAAHEERELRQRALRQVTERLLTGIRGDGVEGADQAWTGTLPLALPILFSRSEELLREGAVYVPVSSVPPAQRDPLVARLQPELDAQHVLDQKFISQIRARMAEQGEDPGNTRFAGEDGPAAPASGCTLIAEIDVEAELVGRVTLKTGIGVSYPWLEASGDALQDAAQGMYAEHHPRLPAMATARPVDGPSEGGPSNDPFTTPVQVPAQPSPKKGDWIEMLSRLSTASGLSLYADCYTNYHGGIDRHPRADFVVQGAIVPEQALDSVCFPARNRGLKRLSPGGLWWRTGRCAVIRSRRWLWEEVAVLPDALADRLTASLRARHGLSPDDVTQLAALNGLQVRNSGFLSGHQDTWFLAVRLPARLSAAAREQLVHEGITWNRLSAPDQAVLARLLPPDRRTRYQAGVQASVSDLPAQGGAVATVDFRTGWDSASDQSVVHFPLPGVSPDESLTPHGLEVDLRP